MHGMPALEVFRTVCVFFLAERKRAQISQTDCVGSRFYLKKNLEKLALGTLRLDRLLCNHDEFSLKKGHLRQIIYAGRIF